MKKSSLFEQQKSLGAVFGDYSEWQLPQRYSDAEDEYAAAKNACALMDRSNLGRLKVSGQDHVDLLHRMTSNELRRLRPGEGQINIFPNEKGRIVARVVLLKFEDSIWLLTSSEKPEEVSAWIDKFTFLEDVQVEDQTTRVGQLTLFGAKAPLLLNQIFQTDFRALPDRHFKSVPWQERLVTLVRSEELGVPGFDLLLSSSGLSGLWHLLLQRGAKFGIKPMGQEAYEVLRIEAGWPLFNKDYGADMNPHEANLSPYLSFTKGCYIGQEVIARLDTYEKVQKYLTGLILEGTAKPQKDDPILVGGQDVGRVTSATHSPALNKTIAMGYVRTKFIQEQAEVLVKSGDQQIPGHLIQLPFVT
ncbi:MAG: aminomethyltransferase family protein [bacterium]